MTDNTNNMYLRIKFQGEYSHRKDRTQKMLYRDGFHGLYHTDRGRLGELVSGVGSLLSCELSGCFVKQR